MRMSLTQLAAAMEADLPAGLPGDIVASGVSTDTRTLRSGDLYIALTGERFDGHDYVDRAFEAGAVAAVVKNICPQADGGRQFVVAEPLGALGRIASAWRQRFEIPVIAVTGSVGKTTTKEMIACALRPLGAVVKTEGNENNEIGLPKTLLRIDEGTSAAVVEMGMRGSGQIAGLAEIARPTIGIITMIGESHIELLGSRGAIAAAKSELFTALAATDGCAVFNSADEFAADLRDAAGRRILTFTDGSSMLAPPSNFRLMDVARDNDAWLGRAIGPGNAQFVLRVVSSARHDLINALGAVAVAFAAGVPAHGAAVEIGSYRPGSMRMELLSGREGSRILSDCYNAAPASMKAALETLSATAGSGRSIAFLGDMKELGPHAAAMHADVVRSASDFDVTELYVVGEEFSQAARHARRKFETSADAARFARDELELHEGDVVLVKGSRSIAMEAVVEALKKPEAVVEP